jgi:hypothetical protein
VISTSRPETPLEVNPMILMSSLRWVPFTSGAMWTWTPSTAAREVPITCSACSYLATVQGALPTHVSSSPSWFGAPQCLKYPRPLEAESKHVGLLIPKNR